MRDRIEFKKISERFYALCHAVEYDRSGSLAGNYG